MERKPTTPQAWMDAWKSVGLRPDWQILEKRDNGYLLRGTYIDLVYDEEAENYIDESPVIAVLCTIDQYEGSRWAHISYTVSSRLGPRGPLPKEVSLVRDLFCAGTIRIGAPQGWSEAFGNPLMKHFWINIDEKEPHDGMH